MRHHQLELDRGLTELRCTWQRDDDSRWWHADDFRRDDQGLELLHRARTHVEQQRDSDMDWRRHQRSGRCDDQQQRYDDIKRRFHLRMGGSGRSAGVQQQRHADQGQRIRRVHAVEHHCEQQQHCKHQQRIADVQQQPVSQLRFDHY